jgi:hypothetical protein
MNRRPRQSPLVPGFFEPLYLRQSRPRLSDTLTAALRDPRRPTPHYRRAQYSVHDVFVDILSPPGSLSSGARRSHIESPVTGCPLLCDFTPSRAPRGVRASVYPRHRLCDPCNSTFKSRFVTAPGVWGRKQNGSRWRRQYQGRGALPTF